MWKPLLIATVLFAPLAACEEPEEPKKTSEAKSAAAVVSAPAPVTATAEASAAPKKPKKKASDCPAGNEITFEHAALEAEVRRKLGKEEGKITKADLAKVKSINIAKPGVEMDEIDICIFPHFTGLTHLFLPPGQIDDLSPISGLLKLEGLRASLNHVRDAKPIESLVKLDRLDLGHTQVSDLRPLESMTLLTELALDNTPVDDVTSIAKLTKLERLSLQNTRVKDIKPLKALKELKFLYIKGSPIDEPFVVARPGLKVIED